MTTLPFVKQATSRFLYSFHKYTFSEDQTLQDALKDPITKETSTEPPEEISVKKKSIKKRSSAKKAVTPAQRQKIKKELVTRMQKLNSMLKQKLNEPETIGNLKYNI